MNKIKILFIGGGSGGHLMPLIAVSREIKRLSDNGEIKFYYIGPNDKMGLPMMSRENFKIHTILSGKIRNYFSFENITDILFKIPLGFLQSFFILFFMRPKLVFSKGGSGSAIVALCAKIL